MRTLLGKTSAISATTRFWISGARASSYARKDSELAVESWPAIMNMRLFPIISCSKEKTAHKFMHLSHRLGFQVKIAVGKYANRGD